MLRKRFSIVLLHAFVGWSFCAAVIGVGFRMTSVGNALIIHAIAVPLIFGSISAFYFRRFSGTSPLQTAVTFLLFAAVMDFFLVGLVIQRDLTMFASAIGTWIPFASIFLTTYVVGVWTTRRHRGTRFIG